MKQESARSDDEESRKSWGWQCLGTATDPSSFCILLENGSFDSPDAENWITCSAVLRDGAEEVRVHSETMLTEHEVSKLASLCSGPSSSSAGTWWTPMEPYLAFRRTGTESEPVLGVLLAAEFLTHPEPKESLADWQKRRLEDATPIECPEDEERGASISCSDKELASFARGLRARLETLRR